MPEQLPKLVNDTVINVAQLLKLQVGNHRQVEFHLDEFQLDAGLWAHNVDGAVRLTRIATGILVRGTAHGTATLECVRCLNEFEASFDTTFDGEFQPSIDVTTGYPMPRPESDEVFIISHNHELDLKELLRQEAIVALPMRPVCGDSCLGFVAEYGEESSDEDQRFAVLRNLLDERAG